MEEWLIWVISGGALIVLELLVPGAITVFVGLAAIVVGLGIKFGLLTSLTSVVVTFIVSTLFLLIVVRTFFLKYFEGDSTIHNVDEEKEAQGSVVLVEEEIQPYKEGRVHFRGSTWQARSDEEISKGKNAIVIRTDGNILIVKPIEE